MYHFIVSPTILNDFPGEELLKIAGEITDQYFPGHQVIYRVHENTDNKHLHFAINAINMVTGRRKNFFPPIEQANIMQLIENHPIQYRDGIFGLKDKIGITDNDFSKLIERISN